MTKNVAVVMQNADADVETTSYATGNWVSKAGSRGGNTSYDSIKLGEFLVTTCT